MDLDAYIGHIRSAGAAMVTAAHAGLHPTVPSCPDWSVADLVGHTGRVHRWVTEMVRTRATTRHSRVGIVAPHDDALVAWFERGLEELTVTLEATDPETPVWTWGAEQRAGWWRRRMCHETSIHAWDAQATHGEPPALDQDVARDGIDEILEVFIPSEEEPLPDPPGTVHLHCTDTDGEWLVAMTADGVVVTRGHEQGDVAVRATASDLDLLLWRRVRADDVEVLGDRAVLDRFLAWMRL